MQRYKKYSYFCKKYGTMLILGIDPGTRILGYSLIDTDGSAPRLVVMDVLYLRKIVDFHLRMRKIFDTTQRIGAALSRELSYTEYEPAAIKQRVTGNGNAAKEQVAAMLQGVFGFDSIPQYLDASDALAVAYTCHLELSDPLGDIRQQLKPTRVRKSKKQQWADFVSANPERVG